MRGTREISEHDALPDEDGSMIEVHLRELLKVRGMTLAELSERVGVTIVNLSILKNGRARAIRFSTLAKLCGVLDCQPGDLLSCRPDGGHRDEGSTAAPHRAAEPRRLRQSARIARMIRVNAGTDGAGGTSGP